MATEVVFSVRDFSDEYSAVRFSTTALAADGSNWATIVSNIDALQLALAAIVNGHIAKRTIIVEDDKVNDTRPATPYAQRENKWIVRYQDDVTQKKYTFQIPTAELVIMSDGGDDVLDIVGVTVAATFVTWLETYALSPDGNAITVNSMSFGARNI